MGWGRVWTWLILVLTCFSVTLPNRSAKAAEIDGLGDIEFNWYDYFKFDLAYDSKVLGEYYTGSNTGGYFGAILNDDTVDQVRSHGGWTNLQITASPRATLSVGGGADDVRNAEAELAGLPNARSAIAFLFGNGIHEVRPGIKLGVEISGWRTRYANPGPGISSTARDLRLQWTMQGTF